MKILMLTWEYPPRVVGGISRVVYDLSHRLIKDGHEVTVVTYRDGEVPYYEDDKGVKDYRVDNYMIQPNKILTLYKQLENLSNTSFYEYTNDQIEKIFETLEEELKSTKEKLIKENKEKGKKRFEL